MKHLHKKSLYRYATALFAFLCYLGLCLGIFFFGIQKAVEKETCSQLSANIARQSRHLKDVVDLQFETLAGLAAYIGQQETPLTPENHALIQAMVDKSSFCRMIYTDAGGAAITNDGETLPGMGQTVSFQKAMQGEYVVSDPVEEKNGGGDRFVLSVPITSGGAVTGVLSGSCDALRLSEIFFSDLYDGSGYVYIVDNQGKLIMMDRKHSSEWKEVNFFDFYKNITFEKGTTLDDVRDDFNSGRGAVRQVSSSGSDRYLAYEPVGYNNWTICYVVSQESAQEGYAFIHEYEVALSLFVVAGLIILLAVLQYINARDRSLLVIKAQTDAMTGLYNAVSTREAVDAWLAVGERQGMQALIMLDIDRFKDVNDTFGHAVGDEALRRSAALLKKHFRGSDIVGRIGGDEFVVFMKNIPGDTVVDKQLSRLCAAFHEIRISEAPGLRLTCSAGASLYPRDGKNFEALYKRADEALYQVKRGARDGFEIYNNR